MGGVTDIVFARALDIRKTLTQGIDNNRRIVNRQGGLSNIGQIVGVADLERFDLILVFDQIHLAAVRAIVLTHRALDFRMTFVADQDAFATRATKRCDFDVDFGHQWTGRIEHTQPTLSSLGLHSLGYAVRTEDHDRIVWHLV